MVNVTFSPPDNVVLMVGLFSILKSRDCCVPLSIISPALAIYHEFGHALGVETNFDKYVDDVRTVDSQYENREEKRVVTTVETPKAIELGEPVRNNHKYRELKDVQDITYHKKNGIEFNHEY